MSRAAIYCPDDIKMSPEGMGSKSGEQFIIFL